MARYRSIGDFVIPGAICIFLLGTGGLCVVASLPMGGATAATLFGFGAAGLCVAINIALMTIWGESRKGGVLIGLASTFALFTLISLIVGGYGLYTLIHDRVPGI